jgi:hypothetical protein
MEKEQLIQITETVDGYAVKDLTWLPLDNVIRGLVKCPVVGKETLHGGYVVATWRKNGSLMPRYGGNTRTDLYLKIIK